MLSIGVSRCFNFESMWLFTCILSQSDVSDAIAVLIFYLSVCVISIRHQSHLYRICTWFFEWRIERVANELCVCVFFFWIQLQYNCTFVCWIVHYLWTDRSKRNVPTPLKKTYDKAIKWNCVTMTPTPTNVNWIFCYSRGFVSLLFINRTVRHSDRCCYVCLCNT